MHIIQTKILKLAQEKNLAKFTLREIGELVGTKSPQMIKHHLQQLEKKGLIRIDKVKGLIEKSHQGWVKGLLKKAKLFAIPILGVASAGPAQIFAEQNIEGYLRVSDTLLKGNAKSKLFAIKVNGSSMNRAEIDNKKIEDGDFVIVNSEDRTPHNGEIILSVIDGMANIKRFHEDRANHQIMLLSDSTQEFPPIYIHGDDDYLINGRVVQVVKKPSL